MFPNERLGVTLDQLLQQYEKEESRGAACKVMKCLSSQERQQLVDRFMLALVRVKRLEALFVWTAVGPGAVLAPLWMQGRVSSLVYIWVALPAFLIMSVVGIALNGRLMRDALNLRGAICELTGPEVVRPLVGLLAYSDGPFSSGLNPAPRVAALQSIARSLGSLDGPAYDLKWIHERFLLRFAIRLTRQQFLEPWEVEFIAGVRLLATRFRATGAAVALNAAIDESAAWQRCCTR